MFIDKNIIQLDCSSHSHVFLIKQDDGWTMIDTGFPGQFKNIINELSLNHIALSDIKQILLTHGDVDHVGNLKKIIKKHNCPVYAHTNEIPYLLKQKHYSKRKHFLKILFHTPKFPYIKPFPKDLGEIKIIEAFGHTPGHVCIRYHEYLFIGDLLNSRDGVINLMNEKFTYDKELSINSIKNLLIDGIKYLCPAHGSIIKIEDFKRFHNTL